MMTSDSGERLPSGKLLNPGERVMVNGMYPFLVPCPYCGRLTELIATAKGERRCFCRASCRRSFLRDYCKIGGHGEGSLLSIYYSALGFRPGGFVIDRQRLPAKFVEIIHRIYSSRDGGHAWGYAMHPRGKFKFVN